MGGLRLLCWSVLLAGAILIAPAGGARAAVTVGISDQQAQTFSDARLRALGMRHARLVVPWDAATSEPGRVQAWLDAARAAGMAPHIAFEHLRSDRCPGTPCTIPTRAQYRAAVAAFHRRFSAVRTFTTWNEANHRSQPVASRPEAVAQFHRDLVAVCGGCTVVAGDVLDSGSYVRWLQRFLAASPTPPRLWGLHNYADATYGRTTGTDAVLATVPGRLWIEETGGLVALRDASGRATLPADESRAARAIDQAFAIAARRLRVTRMYLYHWRANTADRFDAGLVRPDASERPSLARVRRNLAALAPLRWSAQWSTVAPGRLVLRVTCPAVAARCAGRVSVALRAAGRTNVLASRAYRTTTARRTTLRVVVPCACSRDGRPGGGSCSRSARRHPRRWSPRRRPPSSSPVRAEASAQRILRRP